MDIDKEKANRLRLLDLIYENSGASIYAMLDTDKLQLALNVSGDEWERLETFLVNEGLITRVAFDSISITHQGIKEIEDSRSSPEKSTDHFPPVNIIIMHDVHDAQIQQGTLNSSQNFVKGRDISDKVTHRESVDKSAYFYFSIGIFLALLQWGVGLIGITLNAWLGAGILVLAFILMTSSLWVVAPSWFQSAWAQRLWKFMSPLGIITVYAILIVPHFMRDARTKQIPANPVSNPLGTPAGALSKRGPVYSVHLGSQWMCEGLIWGVYNIPNGQAIAPISAMIEIRLTNLQEKFASLTGLSLELLTDKGWMRLRRLPFEGLTLYGCSQKDFKKAKKLHVEPADIMISLTDANIAAGQTVTGIGIFEYADRSYRVVSKAAPRYRVTITDAANHKEVSEIDGNTEDGINPEDKYSQIGGRISITCNTGEPVDISNLPIKWFLFAD